MKTNNFPRLGVAIILRNNGKVLLGKRKSQLGNATWGFPGGKLESGESFETCAIRETKEETSLAIQHPTFFAITNDIFPDGQHFVTIFMISDYTNGEIKVSEPDKMQEWRWFSWNDLPNPFFLPIQNLQKQKRSPFTI